MYARIVIVLFAIIAAVSSQQQAILKPFKADGFETVILDDMSFVTELNIQTAGANLTNVTFYIYGDRHLRTVYTGREYYVGATPNENWHLPFIDFHTFTDGNDIWGIGPINALYSRNRTAYSGFQFEIAVITTRNITDNPRGRFFLEQPPGFEGTFFTTRVVAVGDNNVIGYFCGFFPANSTNPEVLQFGIKRAHFNVSFFTENYDPNARAWEYNYLVDKAVIYHNAQFVTFNAEFKPFLLHARNVYDTAPPNTTYLIVIDPYTNVINLITGNVDQTVPLNVSQWNWVPTRGNGRFGRIVSAVVWGQYVYVGVSVDGSGTGWIDCLHIANFSQPFPSIDLPANFSDPRALVIDYFAPKPTLYVAPNGGGHIVKIDLDSFSVTGYQPLPEYLHRTWRGISTHEHIYFVTNEQHSKVYRMFKGDFCPAHCPEFGYCENGSCVCGPNFSMKDGKCQWKELIVERHTVSKEKGGEVALGILFAITIIVAAAGWYLVWKNRRGAYQAV